MTVAKVMRSVADVKLPLSSDCTFTTTFVRPVYAKTWRTAYNFCEAVGPVSATAVPVPVVVRAVDGWAT